VPPPNITNPAIEKGKRLEPKARALYELKTGREMPAKVVEYASKTPLSASLDDINEAENRIIEIKYVGIEYWKKTAETGAVREDHYCQMQHQLLVTGAKVCDYCAYNDDIDEITIVEVEPNLEFIRDMVQKLEEFWTRVLSKTPPDLTNRDYKIIQDRTLKQLVTEWKIADDKRKELEAELKELRLEIIARTTHPRMRYRDIKIMKINRRGAVDYKNIPELSEVNLDDFRKKDTEYWQIKADLPDKET